MRWSKNTLLSNKFISSPPGAAFPLSKPRTSQPYSRCLKDDRLVSSLYEINREVQLSIRSAEDGFNFEKRPIPQAKIENEKKTLPQ